MVKSRLAHFVALCGVAILNHVSMMHVVKMATRLRCDLTVERKYEIVTFIKKNPEMKRMSVAQIFSLPLSTLSGIIASTFDIE